jgi:CRP/FNR family putative post-exponential-phase nitrogen-starvation transcriptional regulator
MSHFERKEADASNGLKDALLSKYAPALPPLDGYAITARRFAAGEMLADAGEPMTCLCFLVEGYATVYNAMENGRAALLTEYRGVQTIGEVELLSGRPALTDSVRASTRGAMLCLPIEGQREKLLSDAAMLMYLGREVALKLERSSRLNAQDRLYPLSARLAAYLLYAQAKADAYTPLSPTRVSEMSGASYRHVLRTLRSFCDRGYICRQNGGYRITDRQALVRLAGALRYD